MTQNQANFCVKCKARFDKWDSYYTHVVKSKCSPKIVPTRTTTRTHDQIVADVEKTFGKGLIFAEEIAYPKCHLK